MVDTLFYLAHLWRCLWMSFSIGQSTGCWMNERHVWNSVEKTVTIQAVPDAWTSSGWYCPADIGWYCPGKYLQRKLRRKLERLMWKGLSNATLMVKLKLLMSSFLNFYPKEVLEVSLNFSGFCFFLSVIHRSRCAWIPGSAWESSQVLPTFKPTARLPALNTPDPSSSQLKAGFEFSCYSVIYLLGIKILNSYWMLCFAVYSI